MPSSSYYNQIRYEATLACQLQYVHAEKSCQKVKESPAIKSREELFDEAYQEEMKYRQILNSPEVVKPPIISNL